MFGHVNSPKALTQIQCGPVLAHRAAFFRSVQSSTAGTAMTCLRAEPALRCCPCRCEKSIATLHGTVRGSFNQAGVFSAREQWTTKSKRRESHDVWREQFQAGSVRRQLLSGRAITLVPERWIGPSGAARHSEPGRQMSSAASMPLLLLPRPRPRPRSRARCESPALASGVASPLTGVASLPGFSGACEGPGRSFHPTAVERRNGRLRLVGWKIN